MRGRPDRGCPGFWWCGHERVGADHSRFDPAQGRGSTAARCHRRSLEGPRSPASLRQLAKSCRRPLDKRKFQLKITDIEVIAFMTTTDRYENGEPLPKKEIVQTVTRVVCDDGAEGYCLGGQYHGEHDGLDEVNRSHVTNRIKPMLLGFDPLDREKFWHWMRAAKIPEHALTAVDVALWDLASRVARGPPSQLLVTCRYRLLAYASTYPNIGLPQNYPHHAHERKQRG